MDDKKNKLNLFNKDNIILFYENFLSLSSECLVGKFVSTVIQSCQYVANAISKIFDNILKFSNGCQKTIQMLIYSNKFYVKLN